MIDADACRLRPGLKGEGQIVFGRLHVLWTRIAVHRIRERTDPHCVDLEGGTVGGIDDDPPRPSHHLQGDDPHARDVRIGDGDLRVRELRNDTLGRRPLALAELEKVCSGLKAGCVECPVRTGRQRTRVEPEEAVAMRDEQPGAGDRLAIRPDHHA